MCGFGCNVTAYDIEPDLAWSQSNHVVYSSLDTLLRSSDVVSLHVPLTPATHHLVDAKKLGLMKPNSILINTSRGAVIDTAALIGALKTRAIAGACLDVYEHESEIFFRDKSIDGIDDDLFARLMFLPNVLITGHQAFLTNEALRGI